MAGYFGTPEQQSQQARAEASSTETSVTPGLCQNCRMVGCDDIDAVGWPRIFDILARDSFIGFRLLPSDRKSELVAMLAEKGYRLDTWDLFIGDQQEIEPRCAEIIGRPLPDDLVPLPMPARAEGAYTTALQSLISSAGVMPFSGSFLTGELGPVVTVAIGTRADEIAAAAHGYMPHNSSSPYKTYAWGGLVAVGEQQRGRGLGRYVNALLATAIFRNLGASHMYEMISATNLPSKNMAEACGLRHDPAFLCGVATLAHREKYTR